MSNFLEQLKVNILPSILASSEPLVVAKASMNMADKVFSLPKEEVDCLIKQIKKEDNFVEYDIVKEVLATNENLSRFAFNYLMDECDKNIGEGISYFLASNLAVPFFVQKRLLKKSNIVRMKLSSNPFISSRILFILAKDDSYVIRYNVAKNKATSKKTLDILSKDSNEIVRHAVAQNEKTSAKSIRNLLMDEHEYVTYSASMHPKAKNLSAFA